ncbi:hypothetical protein MA20_46625 [Bradyrhizobium japonicum]|uniref:Uncharacterized protein n=1 Tax=Bradyrhizobium japonicum TaxID=375 RepID=A0A0A3XFA0_BRAJP|nr:hypothetical protein AAV28_05775 [Bradyrhizobium diazoefficiens USDA 110]KGT73077.1 hypothetical protein MA20_46625 [Bradyrhizobium japonicum]PDT55986.1 hypothetical protein CO678_40740 [Bradyrhizobium diazoefficiens]QBP20652.1 hypothetical protein Bdiaspc4_08970 [Bradyrhizobium diazoefficiens]
MWQGTTYFIDTLASTLASAPLSRVRAALHHGKRKICFDNCADAMFLLTAPAVTAAVFVILTADLVQEVTLLFMTLFSKCIVANATAL